MPKEQQAILSNISSATTTLACRSPQHSWQDHRTSYISHETEVDLVGKENYFFAATNKTNLLC